MHIRHHFAKYFKHKARIIPGKMREIVEALHKLPGLIDKPLRERDFRRIESIFKELTPSKNNIIPRSEWDEAMESLYDEYPRTWGRFWYRCADPVFYASPLQLRTSVLERRICTVCKLNYTKDVRMACYKCNKEGKGEFLRQQRIHKDAAAPTAEEYATRKAERERKRARSREQTLREMRENAQRIWAERSEEEVTKIVRKGQATLIKKYGSLEKANKERGKKVRESLAKLTDEDWAARRAKITATNQERYGVDVSWASEKVKKKIQQTCLKKYGVRFPSQSPSIREKIRHTNLERYGVDNPTRNPKIARKVLKKSLLTRKVAIEGKTFTVQGSFEEELIGKLVERFGVDNVLTQFSKKFPDTDSWTPDFYIRSKGKYVECKSAYTLMKNQPVLDRNKQKAKLKNCVWIVKMSVSRFPSLWVTLPNKWHRHPDILYLLHSLYLKKLGFQVTENEVTKGNSVFLRHEVRDADKLKVILALTGHHETEVTVGARDTEVRKVSTEVADRFLRFHLQGPCRSSVKLGLFYKSSLVALATFRRPIVKSKENADWELARFCVRPGYRVQGGLSKLLSAFKKLKGSCTLLSFSDKRYSEGKVYKACGFDLVRESQPGYFWIHEDGTFLYRQQAQKHKLAKLLGDEFDPELSEAGNMKRLGFEKVKDKGQLVFMKQL